LLIKNCFLATAYAGKYRLSLSIKLRHADVIIVSNWYLEGE